MEHGRNKKKVQWRRRVSGWCIVEPTKLMNTPGSHGDGSVCAQKDGKHAANFRNAVTVATKKRCCEDPRLNEEHVERGTGCRKL